MSCFLDVAEKAAKEAGKIVINHIHEKHIVENKAGFDFVTEIDKLSEKFIHDSISSAYPDHSFFCEEQMSSGTIDEDSYLKSLKGYTWIVDALDGTTNFIRGIPQFAISIALIFNCEIIVGVVYDPNRDELFSAEKGKGAFLNGQQIFVSEKTFLEDTILSLGFPASDLYKRADIMKKLTRISMKIGSLRVFNCASLLLCYVSCGRTDWTFEEGIHLWDMAAGILLVKEAGGTVLNIDGTPFSIFSKSNLAGNKEIIKKVIELL